MNKDIIIRNKAIIESEDGREQILTESHGSYFEKGGSAYVLYDEETENGDVNKCRLKLSDTELEMRKNGQVSTVMVFDRLKNTSSFFRTPYGSFNLEIKTKRLDIYKSPVELKVKLEYEMSVGDVKSFHKMDIVIEEKK